MTDPFEAVVKLWRHRSWTRFQPWFLEGGPVALMSVYSIKNKSHAIAPCPFLPKVAALKASIATYVPNV